MTSRPVAFITGASRGIGRGIAVEMARCGFDIVGNATTREGLSETEKEVTALGASFEAAPGDIADLECHAALLKTALDRFGRVDTLVNNAGIAPKVRLDVLETSIENYDRVMSVNARGTFFLAQRFANRMLEQDTDSTIIFITSVSVYMATPNRAEYCMSKAAVSHVARIFARRLAGHGIAVYEVRPGVTRSDMTAPVEKMYDQRIREGLIPENRWGLPEDVGRAVSTLSRGEFTYATGSIIEVGGGLHIHCL
jgi:NAD(P)-dependent dehydrogenase (short-subunit alcohol dehydrogenase family)